MKWSIWKDTDWIGWVCQVYKQVLNVTLNENRNKNINPDSGFEPNFL